MLNKILIFGYKQSQRAHHPRVQKNYGLHFVRKKRKLNPLPRVLFYQHFVVFLYHEFIVTNNKKYHELTVYFR